MSICGSIFKRKGHNSLPRAKALGYNTPPFQGGVPYKGKAY